MDTNCQRLKNETCDEYFVRLFSHKEEYGLSSEQITDLLNVAYGTDYTESVYRKRWRLWAKAFEYSREHFNESYLVAQARDLEKQRIRIQDERAALKRIVREEARKDAVRDIVRESLSDYPAIMPFAGVGYCQHDSGGTLVVMVSDLHIGIEFDNAVGRYSIDIARDRLQQYADRVTEFCDTHNPDRCIVLLTGDLISGAIHSTLRIENKENLIGQIKAASELVSNFIGSIGGLFEEVDVYSVSGNHSRAITNKDDCTFGDMLDDLIPFYVETRLADIHNIHIHYGDNSSYITFFIGRNLCVLVHGDFDKMDVGGIGKLQRMVDGVIDCVFIGHLHQVNFADVDGCHVIQSGCLSGSGDEYCIRNRLSGKPSQTMVFFDKDDILTDVMPVYFN